jgi:hypothetical protein
MKKVKKFKNNIINLKLMKYLIFIFCFVLYYSISHATVCDFSGFEKNNNKIYGITQCDNKYSGII